MLYHRTAAQVLGLVNLMLGDTVAAEDVTAAVYQQLWHTAARYEPARGCPHAWVLGVAHRHAAGHLRAYRGKAAASASTATGELASLPPASLPACLERLDAPSRELILLVYYRGYTAAQAASLLGLPAGTAGAHLRMALRALSPDRSCRPGTVMQASPGGLQCRHTADAASKAGGQKTAYLM